MSKRNKVIIGAASGLFAVAGAGLLWWQQGKDSKEAEEVTYKTSTVTEGSISSSTLLTGTVKALQEQYVYYDSTEGTEARPTVSVGDQI